VVVRERPILLVAPIVVVVVAVALLTKVEALLELQGKVMLAEDQVVVITLVEAAAVLVPLVPMVLVPLVEQVAMELQTHIQVLQ
jgi:hypothetical protein